MVRPHLQSLAARHPWRLDVPVLLSASLVLVVLGLLLPAMEIRALIFWLHKYSIISNIENLYRRGKETAALILAACSVVYPLLKIFALFFLWFIPFPADWRRILLRLLRLLGRWSMLDVIAVTAIVLASRVIGPLAAKPLPGMYVYAVGICVLMIAAVLMDILSRSPRTAPRD